MQFFYNLPVCYFFYHLKNGNFKICQNFKIDYNHIEDSNYIIKNLGEAHIYMNHNSQGFL